MANFLNETDWKELSVESNNGLYAEIFPVDQTLRLKFENSKVHYYSLIDIFCHYPSCTRIIFDEGKPTSVAYDYGHFSSPAAKYAAETFAKYLYESGNK